MSLSENLITAAKNGNTKEVRKLLSKGALFTKDQFGNTALHEAAWNGNSDIVKILLTGFCFVDSINNTGFTPLHLASQNGHAKVVKTLLKWKANPTLLNQHGETALHLVAKYDHANVVSSFAAHKVGLDLRGKDGNTSLHIAAMLGNIETAKAMLSAGAHPALLNDRSLKPLECAETGGYTALAKLLNSAMQKFKPKHRNASTSVSPTVVNPRFPYTMDHSLSQPDEYSYLQSPVHAIKPRSQRAMSASAKLKASKDARSPASKRKNKKISPEKEDKFAGSLSPTPHKYFSSQDELDSRGLCPVDTERSASPAVHTQVTIDQLLTEIETEYLGPGYKYKPLQESQYGENNDYSHPRPSKFQFQSTRNVIVTQDNLRTSCSDNEYDYPNNTNSNSNNSPVQTYDEIRVQNEQAHYQTPRQARKLPSPPTSEKGQFKHHTYEPLLPKEDKDTYVYMAPLGDYPELLQQVVKQQIRGSLSPRTSDSQSLVSESGSELSVGGSPRGGKSTKKVAAVRDSPIEADRKYEPNTLLEPIKGILMTQAANNEGEKSQLEDYVQNELETIRQAFQIRLNQLEKRYQRQLEVEKQKHILSPLVSQQTTPTSPKHREQMKQRRNSWHSCMATEQDKNELVLSVELPSGSDFYEHDPSLVNELPESLREGDHSTTVISEKQQNGCTCNKDEFNDYEDMSGGCVVDKGSQELKVSEYRDHIMLQHYKEKSEARIAAIEQEYLSQMNEMQRRCQDTASDNVVQLQSKSQNIEGGVEVQTLV